MPACHQVATAIRATRVIAAAELNQHGLMVPAVANAVPASPHQEDMAVTRCWGKTMLREVPREGGM